MEQNLFFNDCIHKFDKIIFVIDTPIMALATAIMAYRCEISCIYEIKKGIDQDKSYLAMAKAILEDQKIIDEKILIVPSPYFIGFGLNFYQRIKKLKLFIQEVKQLYRVENKVLYVGSKTSSIMRSIPYRQRFFVDHGVEVLSRLGLQYSNSKSYRIKKLIKSLALLFLNAREVYNDNLDAGFGATFIAAKNDYFKHIDFRRYILSNSISHLLRPLKEHAKKYSNVVLFLPTSVWHSENGFLVTPDYYNEINCQLIKQNCNIDDFIIVKFHPTFYLNSDNSSIGLIDLLYQEGFSVIDFDGCIPDEYKGMFPAEIIINSINTTKVVAEMSATLFNCSHIKEIDKVAAPYYYDKIIDRKEKFIKYYELINKLLIWPIEKAV